MTDSTVVRIFTSGLIMENIFLTVKSSTGQIIDIEKMDFTIKLNDMKAFVVKTVNGIEILASPVKDGMVAIKPICDALGVVYSAQFEKLKEDLRFSSTILRAEWLELLLAVPAFAVISNN